MSEPAWKPILGIDLGTSTCLACVIKDGRAVFIEPDRAYYPRDHRGLLAHSACAMPSAFAYVGGQAYAGERGLDFLGDPDHAGDVVTEIKRHLKSEGLRTWRLGGEEFAPSRIAGQYVQVLRRAAEYQLGLPDGSITGAVVTVPASFGSKEVSATKKACVAGGLIEDQIIPIDEPVAAAYALRLHLQEGNRLVLVVDIGGGTFDVTLMRTGRGVPASGFDELGRDGESRLGGLDWDREIARAAAWSALKDRVDHAKINAILDPRPTDDPASDRLFRLAHNRLFRSAERAKKTFYDQFYSAGGQFSPETLERLDVEVKLKPVGRPFSATIAAEDHIDDVRGLVDRCIKVCDRMFGDVSSYSGRVVGWADLDDIYLAGGGSRMATIRHAFERTWREARKRQDPASAAPRVRMAPDPQGAVAEGAAWCAEDLRLGHEVAHVRKKRYPHQVGMVTTKRDGSAGLCNLVARHTVMPFPKPQEFQFLPWIPEEGWDGRIDIQIVEVCRGLDEATPKHVPLDSLTLERPSAGDGTSERVVVSATATPDGILKLDVRWGDREGSLRIDPNAARPATTNGSEANGDHDRGVAHR